VTEAWIDEELATGALGDARLDRRLRGVLARCWHRLHAAPGAACQGWAEVMGAYRLFRNAKVTLASVLAPHQDATTARAAGEPVVLVAQDTTELRYHRQTLVGAGPLNQPYRTGVFLHATVAFTPAGVPLGVLGLHVWARETLGKRQTRARQGQPLAEKESQRWRDGHGHAQTLATAVPATCVVSLADREGDLYEIYADAQAAAAQGPAAHWIVRAYHRRATTDGSGQPLRLQAALAPVVAHAQVPVPARPGQAARVATCAVHVGRVALRPPYRPAGPLPPVTVTAVWVREAAPPAGAEALDWFLLTDLPVAEAAAVRRVVTWYGVRWGIEVFFRTLKTGCRVEALQLRQVDRLTPALALYAILAWRVGYLVMLGRAAPDLPASWLFDAREVQVAWVCTHRGQPRPARVTLGQTLRWIAQVGGFLGRRGDGEPGAETVWRGLQRIYETLDTLDALQENGERCV
jgi:hypothetical protein